MSISRINETRDTAVCCIFEWNHATHFLINIFLLKYLYLAQIVFLLLPKFLDSRILFNEDYFWINYRICYAGQELNFQLCKSSSTIKKNQIIEGNSTNPIVLTYHKIVQISLRFSQYYDLNLSH